MTENNSIVLSTKKQLIDINKNHTNFRAHIVIQSTDGSPFYVAFVEQEDLDNDKQIDYQTAETGVIETEIEYNDNKLKNYYLIAVADTPTECKYSIELTELPPNVVAEPHPLPSQTQNQQVDMKESSNILFVGAVCVVGAILVYYLFFTKSETKEEPTKVVAKAGGGSGAVPPVPRVVASSSESAHSPVKPLTAMDRLKKLNIP